jgi:hypothetical protein
MTEVAIVDDRYSLPTLNRPNGRCSARSHRAAIVSWLLALTFIVVAGIVTSDFVRAAQSTFAGAGAGIAPATVAASPLPSQSEAANPGLIDSELGALLGVTALGDQLSVSASYLAGADSYDYCTSCRMTAASVIKIDILATLLLQHQDARTWLNSTQQELAQDMMRHSDNDAADTLWANIGGSRGLAWANERFGLVDTIADPNGYWGLTTTSAADQVRLLTVLTTTDSLLGARARAYELELMGDVDTGQSWGVSAAADDPSAAQLKNGWLQVSTDNDLWTLNSVGVLAVGGQIMLIAVLVQHQPNYDAGISLLEDAAQLVAQSLTATP